MKQIEKIKKKFTYSIKQKTKKVNCLTGLEEKFAYKREARNNSLKEKKILVN
jgi:hypothetical protein